MFPGCTITDSSQRKNADSEFGGKPCLILCPLLVERFHFQNLLRGQFGHAMVFALIHPSFSRCVLHIFKTISQPKVVWVHARRVVAAMKNPQAFRDRATVDDPTCSIRSDDSFPGTSNYSVTPLFFCARPQPASVGLVDLGPKAFCERFTESLRGEIFGRNFGLRSIHRMLCRALGWLHSARAFRFLRVANPSFLSMQPI